MHSLFTPLLTRGLSLLIAAISARRDSHRLMRSLLAVLRYSQYFDSQEDHRRLGNLPSS